MIENIRLSFQGIWSHKMRSFLTMLGIIIGIAAIIAIVSIIQGTNQQIEQNLIGSGGSTVNVQIYQGDYPLDFTYEQIPSGIPLIDKETVEKIKALDEVENVSLFMSRQDYDGVYYLNQSISGGYIYGVDPQYFETCDYVLRKGRGFTSKDYEQFKKVAILDENSAKSLFQGEEAVGKTIEVKGRPYVVVGVVTKLETFEPVINSIEDYYMYQQRSSGIVYVPDATWPAIYRYDEPQSIAIKGKDTKAMTSAGQKTADLINGRLSVADENIKYKSENLLEQAKQIQQLSQSTNMMLIWIAGISLLVGGIGVMNIMLVSVTERTNEIGLKKAIGARKKMILMQFLTESVVLTSLGGILGVIVGIILAQVISKINVIPIAISVPAAILSVSFSMLIGIVFGIIPSYKAANLDPIEALRHE